MATVRTGVDRLAYAGVLIGGLGFVGLLLGVELRWAWLIDLDRSVVHAAHAAVIDQGWLVGLLVLVDRLFDPWVLRGIGLIVAAVLYRRGERRVGFWLGTAAFSSAVFEWLLKLLIDRPRPEFAEEIAIRHSPAMPSGHALTSAVIVGGLLVLVQRDWSHRRRRVLAWLGGVLFVLLLGADRVLLAVHNPSDVVAGWLVAVAMLAALGIGFGLTPGAVRRRSRKRARARGLGRRRLAVVVNPAKLEDPTGFRQQLDRLADERGWRKPTWYETTVDDPGYAMARAALADKADLVIAAGGDGTVRAVCAVVGGTETPVGVVPVGTGNLLARNLGLPLEPASAIRAALGGRDRRIDLVRVSGDGLPTDRFAVMAGMGLDAAVVGEAPAKLKARLGWPAYVVSIVRNLSFPAVRVDIGVDDAPPTRHWARTVVVGNVGTLHVGLLLLPGAAPDDGRIDVALVAPRRLTDWPRLAWRVVSRSSVRDDRLSHWRGSKVVIRTVESCPRQLDGDVVEDGHELKCEVEPGVLLIRVPAGPG